MASIRSAGRKSQVKRKHPLKEFSFMMCCKSCTTEKAWKQTNKPHEEKDLTLRLQVQRLLGHMMTSIKMSKDQSWTSHCNKCFIKATRKHFVTVKILFWQHVPTETILCHAYTTCVIVWELRLYILCAVVFKEVVLLHHFHFQKLHKNTCWKIFIFLPYYCCVWIKHHSVFE